MIVLDAGVLIAFLAPADTHHARAEDLILHALDAGTDLLINTLNLSEVLVFPTREGPAALALTAARLAAMITEVPIPPAARELANLRVTSGLKLPDCAVLLTAHEHHSAVATFDDRLRRAAHEQKIAIALDAAS